MKDFSKIIGQDMQDIRRGLESARLTTVTPDAPKDLQTEAIEGIARRAAKVTQNDTRMAGLLGMSVEELQANRGGKRAMQASTRDVAAPIATPGQAQGKGAGLQL